TSTPRSSAASSAPTAAASRTATSRPSPPWPPSPITSRTPPARPSPGSAQWATPGPTSPAARHHPAGSPATLGRHHPGPRHGRQHRGRPELPVTRTTGPVLALVSGTRKAPGTGANTGPRIHPELTDERIFAGLHSAGYHAC